MSIETQQQQSNIFRSLDENASGVITKGVLLTRLQKAGIQENDQRIQSTIESLNTYKDDQLITPKEFLDIVGHNITVIEKALKGHFVIPNFQDFSNVVTEIAGRVKEVQGGTVADYIPELAKVDPNKFAVSVCTVDGQRFDIGDFDEHYCIQSTCKPVNYSIAIEENGEEKVNKHIGREPSGQGFNELTLNKDGLPHNPMINAGAIMACSLIKPDLDLETRLRSVMEVYEQLTGRHNVRFDEAVYQSEFETADRNFALGYFMKEKGAFEKGVDLVETLKFYFQTCSIELTAQDHATVAATLANAGVCPTTGQKVFSPNTVKDCLSLMYSCGMYDFSGEFSFTIGLPAKSGVSGALLVVVPNVMGITIWAPPLDQLGNSVKGLEFCKELIRSFNFHTYDAIAQKSGKIDPRLQKNETKFNGVNSLCSAASQGDIDEIKKLASKGLDLNEGEYDRRTPIHLAASEGHEEVVRFFIENGLELNQEDRWGGTPLTDAYRSGHTQIAEMLEKAGAKGSQGEESAPQSLSSEALKHLNLEESIPLCWAASQGDLAEIERLVANGVDLDAADYDGRTGIHLAASEGHVEVVQYCIDQGANLAPVDRWGNTPLEDAKREKHPAVASLLQKHLEGK